MKRTPILILLALTGFALVALACNLGSSNSLPPTLVPRATDTPLPTIGYSTLSPDELPPAALSAPSVDANLISLTSRIEADRLFIHVDALQAMQTRHVNSPPAVNTGVEAAYRYVRGQFETIQRESAGRFVVLENEFPLTWAGLETIQRNVYGVIQGTEIGGGIIVIGAHYDSVSIDPEDPLYPAPGANDNASGVAALIEMARVLSVREHRATLMFVAFAAEEVGREGSRAFVRFLEQQNIASDVRAMINLDIIGSQTGPTGQVNDSQIRLFSASPNDSTSRQLARAIYLIDFNLAPSMEILVQDSVDRENRYGDHMSFSEADIPAVRFTEVLEDRGRQHSPSDTIDDIQASYLTRATQTILTVITALADGPQPPRNISLRDNGDGKRRLVWEPAPDAASYLIGLRRPGSVKLDTQFPWTSNQVDWEYFTSAQFAGLVIASVDANGLMGPPSPEFLIP